MNLPQIGELVNVRHTVDRDKRDVPWLVPAKKVLRKVGAVYSGDNDTQRIKDDRGDVWNVVPNNDNSLNAHWMTVPVYGGK